MSEHGENLFKALADRQRRKILEMLRRGELAAGDIASALELAPATVSHHLAKLKAANLVRTRRAGQQRIYALNVSVVEEALLLIAGLLKSEKEHEQ
ncbi:MAG: winged helix-turn-helix transcriptional regulator [Xanthomonadales bacterium]|nr:metalloregulator ArsR/SmtB family transcription factor [Gammaproteobacteria bacterium]NNE04467.1 winged helix-turn-helix transcriptional regulator [Xanthomonadales bacterium]NNL95397.1 winged helix-turn-helix transcriptional regulator [Xanthomonadales bacterium]